MLFVFFVVKQKDQLMARFPRREAEVHMLAQEMIAGYKANPTVFVNADVPTLETALTEFQDARQLMLCMQSMAKSWTERKDGALDELKTVMRLQLAKSEIDTTQNPKQLKLIGSGPKAKPHPIDPPGMPQHLTIIKQGMGTIEFAWKPPATNAGGPIRNYVVLRRDKPDPNKSFGPWQQSQAAIETETFLTNQPQGIDLEYRIVAINSAGTSVPSNTAAAVL